MSDLVVNMVMRPVPNGFVSAPNPSSGPGVCAGLAGTTARAAARPTRANAKN